MKLLIIFFATVAVSWARPAGDSPSEIQIVKSENIRRPDGSYQFSYETSDGSKREEIGEIVNAGTDDEALIVRGSYTYIGPDGVPYTVNYVADQNGYQPQGAHLPNAPSAHHTATASPTATRVNPPTRLQSVGAFGALVG